MYCDATKIIMGSELPESGGFICPSFALPYSLAILKQCRFPGLLWNPTLQECSCSEGHVWVPQANRCVPYIDRYADKPSAPQLCFGNPIFPLTGSKREVIELGRWFGRSFELTYDSRRMSAPEPTSAALGAYSAPSFGALWAGSFDKRLVHRPGIGLSTVPSIQAARGAGIWITFLRNSSGSFVPDADLDDRIVAIPGGWRYTDARSQSEEIYDSAGFLRSIRSATGSGLSLSYSDAATPAHVAPAPGLLVEIADEFGRAVGFEYEQPADATLRPRIVRSTDPAGHATTFSYDAAGRLAHITWPDGGTKRLHYEDATLPQALTGVTDENGMRIATYGYDAQGHVTSTQRAGGVGSHGVSWTLAPGWQIEDHFDEAAHVVWRDHSWVAPEGTVVTLPNGQTSALTAVSVRGMPRLTSQSRPAGSGCAASARFQVHDANGNVTLRDDFNGNRSCHAYDAGNRETARVEGLSGSVPCASVISAGAPLPAGARRITTQWHPDWRLPARVTEPGRVTTFVYHGRPDPYAGNVPASCAPAGSTLPSGKPIAVLCRKTVQATTDPDGNQEASATPEPGVPPRTWRWTYNQHGQPLSARGPRTDIDETSTYGYHDSVTADHRPGDLAWTRNPLGQLTQYPRYDPHGQVLETIDPNGVVTTTAFDRRQRMTSISVDGELVQRHEYDLAGRLMRVTGPDGNFHAFEYDAARRPTAVVDHLGNRIDYVLDNQGNRISETIRDPAGTLRRQLGRSIDALGRVQQIIGRE